MRALIALVLILALLGAGGYLAVRQIVPASREERGPVYATVPVERGDVEVVVEGFGNLDPMFFRDVQSPAQGTVEEVFVSPNQRVKRGDLIAVIRNDQIGFEAAQKRFELEQLRSRLAQLLGVPPSEVTRVPATAELTIRAPAAGRVVDLRGPAGDGSVQPWEPGMEVAESQRIATIVEDARVVVVAELYAGEASRVEVGQEVAMAVEGFDGSVAARVVDVNRNPVPSGDHFVYRTTIEAANPGLLRPGQQVWLTFRTAAGDMAVGRPFRIERYARQVAVYSAAKGTVVRVHAREGALVGEGDPLLTLGGQLSAEFLRGMQDRVRQLELELAQKQAIIANLELRSPLDGVVAWVNASPGMQVQQGQPIAGIFDSRAMRMVIRVDELDVLYLRDGMAAEVRVEALPGKVWKAKVVRVDSWGKNEQGIAQYGVMLDVEGTDELRPGMSATVRIPVGLARGVLRVPVEAVFEEDGGHAVEVLVDGRPETVRVELGLVNDRWAEVKSGLAEGQLVVVGSSLERLQGSGGPQPASPLGLPRREAGPAPPAPPNPPPVPAEPVAPVKEGGD